MDSGDARDESRDTGGGHGDLLFGPSVLGGDDPANRELLLH
jgi:hypothetical protein